jgi:hypothetical protein
MDKPIPDVKCPNCFGPVTYNGNYYCMEGGCGWALPTDPTPKRFREWYAIAYFKLLESRGQEADPQVIIRILEGD